MPRGVSALIPTGLIPGLRPALPARAEAADAARRACREAKGRGCAAPGVRATVLVVKRRARTVAVCPARRTALRVAAPPQRRRLVSSFRATATRATIFGLPSACLRPALGDEPVAERLEGGVVTGRPRWVTAPMRWVTAPMKRAALTEARPPPMAPRPFRRPDCRVQGADPAAPAPAFRRLRALPATGAGDARPGAGDRGEQVLAPAPGRAAAHVAADLGVELGGFARQGFEEALDALLRARLREAPQALPLGHHHGDGLAPPGDEVGQAPPGGWPRRAGAVARAGWRPRSGR
jgi:hypothetical protein